MIYTSLKFQSTPSSRKVTAVRSGRLSPVLNFNPHLPRGRWRLMLAVLPGFHCHFNPHLPRGRWLKNYNDLLKLYNISIHTFLAEGDLIVRPQKYLSKNFNPHLPRGRWRTTTWCFKCYVIYFNPHLPRGRWPRRAQKAARRRLFQSTPSSRKVTMITGYEKRSSDWFQSTPSSRKVTYTLYIHI